MYLYTDVLNFIPYSFLVALAKFMLFFKYVNLVALGLYYACFIN